MVQLSEELLARLDAEAARGARSRSAVIRDAVERYLASSEDDSIGRAIAEGYRRIPPGTPDGWGDLEAANDLDAADVADRLDAEEQKAGFGPWET